MRVRIYQRPKSAMQSGQAGTHVWVLDYEPADRRRADPLMGWIGGADTQRQVQLHFDTKEEAIAFAEKDGLAYEVELPHQRAIKPKAYADNFRYGRLENWTH
ncbi:MAG TPA: ETC complex I subunit [Acidisphaera sp.]|nr:ETC complex I subunit [Acidisphaera sp.]